VQILFFACALFLIVLMLLTLYRAAFGPTILDRMMGANAVGSKTVVLLLLIGLIYERLDMFLDIALAYALLNFLAVLTASRYLQKRRGLSDEP